MRRIYLDHAATTPVDPRVAEAMAAVYRDAPGNPSSIHDEGRQARALMDTARERVAAAIGAEPSEIVFTSGGTEADNLAVRGTVAALRHKGDHVVTTAIEHHAVLDTVSELEREQNVRLTVLPVDRYGRVDPEDVREAITARTVLVSVMHANNEIGTIEPIAEIGRICRERNVVFHSDAVQTVGALEVDVRRLPVDLLSLNAHKFYGPKGVGALYVRKGTPFARIQTGGGQERDRRAGTENVAGIVAMGAALEIATRERAIESPRLARLRDLLLSGVRDAIDDVVVNGHPTERLPNNASLCVRGVQGESLIVALDLAGIAASSGAACTTGSLEPSHVLLAIGLSRELAQGSLRLTLGRATTDEDVDVVLGELPRIVSRLRAASPVA
ncbi:MAG: cysteine desulfurase [Chloroflexi bacterium]|nr:MAG: cysteine desulfurase [Chloroflexota bacterium]